MYKRLPFHRQPKVCYGSACYSIRYKWQHVIISLTARQGTILCSLGYTIHILSLASDAISISPVPQML